MDRGIAVDILMLAALPTPWRQNRRDYLQPYQVFTTAFYRKGLIKPLEVLEKDTERTLIQFFRRLVSEDQPDQSKAEEFICSLCGMKGYVKDVNEARHVKLCQMTGKMDKVLVSLCYMGLFLLGKGNKLT